MTTLRRSTFAYDLHQRGHVGRAACGMALRAGGSAPNITAFVLRESVARSVANAEYRNGQEPRGCRVVFVAVVARPTRRRLRALVVVVVVVVVVAPWQQSGATRCFPPGGETRRAICFFWPLAMLGQNFCNAQGNGDAGCAFAARPADAAQAQTYCEKRSRHTQAPAHRPITSANTGALTAWSIAMALCSQGNARFAKAPAANATTTINASVSRLMRT